MSLKQLVGDGFFRIGDDGSIVKAIQLGLAGIGYQLKGAGYFGNATDTAVRAFQKKAGIKVDGVVGAETAAAIDLVESSPMPPAAPVVAEIGRPLWFQAGLALVGTKEVPGAGDNRTIIDWAKEEGGDVAEEYTHDSIPWCALFANHCLTLAGLPGTHSLWALDFAGSWPSVRLDGPAVGAFAPMVRNGGGHIIQIAGRARSGNYMGLGGNQGDQVSIVEFAPSRLNKGFWWPKGVTLPVVGFNHLPIVNSNGAISSREA